MKKLSSLMLLALVFLVLSCRTDQFPEKETYHNSSAFQLTNKRISLNESKHKAKLLPELEQVENKFRALAKNNAQGKLVNFGNGLSIDTENVIYVENGPNYHTYTFKITRENAPADAPVENLVLTPLPDGSYKEFLVSYNLTPQEKQEIANGHSVNLTNKTTITEITTGTNWGAQMKTTETYCYYTTYSEVKPCPCDGHTTLTGCTCTVKATSYTYINQVCEINEVDDTITPLNPEGNNEGNGGGLTPESQPHPNDPPCDPSVPVSPQLGMTDPNGCPIVIPTLPNLSTSFSFLVKNFSTINEPQNVEIYNGLNTYYDANNGSIEAQNFITWAESFFTQNQNVTWAQFQKWFIEEPILNNTLQNELFEDWADPNRVKPTTRFKNHAKLNGIYNKVKTSANFKQYLQNFEPTFSVAHLMFDIGTVTNSTTIAQTREPINYWIKITFNDNWDYPNTPKAIIAYAFMHEMIHAEMLRKLLSISSTPQGNINWNQVMNLLNTHNYPGLFDYYTRYTVSDNDVDHQIMGAHYISIMVNFLKQVYGTQYSDVEYKTIAWSGLRESKAWNLLPQNERQLYIDTWNSNYWLWEK